MSDDHQLPAARRSADVNAFLAKVASVPAVRRSGGRLVFALDATASRQPTWDAACRLQGEMFDAAAAHGGLAVQLVFYRGMQDCKASRWVADGGALQDLMARIVCAAGRTQIERVLLHAAKAARQGGVHAVVFVGDAMEEERDVLAALAGELGLLGVPVFVFHEGGDPRAAEVFREIARLSKGAYRPFDARSANELRELLGAVAVYAAGGRAALEAHAARTGGAALLLTRAMG